MCLWNVRDGPNVIALDIADFQDRIEASNEVQNPSDLVPRSRPTRNCESLSWVHIDMKRAADDWQNLTAKF